MREASSAAASLRVGGEDRHPARAVRNCRTTPDFRVRASSARPQSSALRYCPLNERFAREAWPLSRRALDQRSSTMSRKTLIGIFAALLSVATGASAATISTHGAAFVAYNVGEAINIDFTLGGARTNLAGGQTMIASVVRNTISSGSQTFTISGWHNGVQTTSCTFLSGNADGGFVASKDASATNVSGAWSRSVTMTAAEVPSTTRVTALCTVPGSFAGNLSGILSTP